MKNINKECDHDSSCLIFAILLAALSIGGVFFFNFHSQQLSANITDWGAFGSYIGGTVSIFSVILIYETYNNQVKTNRRTQFESLLFKTASNLKRLQTESIEDWKKVFDGICEYYKWDLVPTELLYKDNIFEAIERSYNYYSSETDIERFMTIFDNVVNYIAEEESITDNRKSEYYAFLSSQMSNEMMIIVMLQLIAKKKETIIKTLDETCFFKDICLGNIVLEKIRDLYYPKTSQHTTKAPKIEIERCCLDIGQGIGTFIDYYYETIKPNNTYN